MKTKKQIKARENTISHLRTTMNQAEALLDRFEWRADQAINIDKEPWMGVQMLINLDTIETFNIESEIWAVIKTR